MTALAGNKTTDTSGQVINLNTNTVLKCVPHILGYLQFLQTVTELCVDAHYYFAHSFNSPLGSKTSSMCLVRRAPTPWATRVGKNSSTIVYQIKYNKEEIWREKASKNGRNTNTMLRLSEVLGSHPGQQINMEISHKSKNNSMQKTNGNAIQQPVPYPCITLNAQHARNIHGYDTSLTEPHGREGAHTYVHS